jgi:hypothetical protein
MRQPRNLADEDDFEDAELDAEHQAILDKLAPLPREQSPNVVRQPKASDLGDALGARLQQQLAPPIPTDPELDELNELFAVVTIGANVRIMTLQESPPIFYHLADFKLLLGNRTKQVTEADNDGQPKKKTILTATWWLKHPNRRQYRGVVFEPGKPDEVDGCRNLWTGFAVQPQAGDCSQFLEFLRDVVCDDNATHYAYLLDVMADTVQRPNKQGDVAIVLRGKEGVGKGFTVNTFGRIFGRHFLPITQAPQVTGKFNGHLAYCLLLFADEAFFAGDRQHESTLKALVTEGLIMIERKGLDAVRSPNLTHLWISSNETWVVPAGPTARRFFCLDVADIRRGDTSYFAAINGQMENGGTAALLDFLLKRDLKGRDIRKVPQTAMLAEQKALSRRGMDALVEWILNEGSIPCADSQDPSIGITTDPAANETLFDWARRSIPDLKHKSPTAMTRTLKQEWGCESWHSGNRRGVRFPPRAELRERFTAKHGPVELDADNGTWG